MESSAELIESLNGDLSTATGSGEGGGRRGTEERRGGVSESNNASHGLSAWVNNVEYRLMHQQRLIVTLLHSL